MRPFITKSLMFTALIGMANGLFACRQGLNEAEKSSAAADVEIEIPQGKGIDTLEVSLISKSSEGTSIRGKTYDVTAGSVSANVEPGEYEVTLKYFRSGALVSSTEFCSVWESENSVTLVVGANKLSLTTCEGPNSDDYSSTDSYDDEYDVNNLEDESSYDFNANSDEEASYDSNENSDEEASYDSNEDNEADITVKPKIIIG